ncbi:MAG: proline--tRNA ligase [Anaerolineales bacterium]|nr:MAG: proline--tRNA ligase [Anaerolineales bacterium]
MRMSKLFSQTLRDRPSEAEISSHELLLRAGFIRQLAAGIFTYMPFAKRSLTKIENIMREEMNAIGGQEISMPVIHPADIWKKTKRWYQIGSEMGRFKDKAGRDMVLAMTHEEVVADLVCKEIHSYRQLPMLIYHIQTKWRDDPRPRAGLIRVREFTMKDSYSLDADMEGLDRQYRAHYQAYFNIFHRSGVPVIAVKSDVGMMGGSLAHEFMYLTPVGEDTLLICDDCGYAANRHIARFRKPKPEKEELLPAEKIETPEMTTIEELADFLGVPKSRTAKAVFMIATIPEGTEEREKFVFAIVRGDMNLNEIKLANTVKAKELRPATDEEIRAVGAVPGYASPIAVKDALVVVDDLIPDSPNLVAGANEEGYHLKNVNIGRDFEADVIADIALAEDGFACPQCDAEIRASRGIEVGNIFKLGTRYTESMDSTFLDQDGETQYVIMGSYGIGSGRLLASAAEEYNDENGLILPITIAPYEVHLLSLKGAEDAAQGVYEELIDAGVEVLYDDREESPGVKFADADLIGLPLRLTVSKRSLKENSVEAKRRDSEQAELIPRTEMVQRVQTLIADMYKEVQELVVEVPFDD